MRHPIKSWWAKKNFHWSNLLYPRQINLNVGDTIDFMVGANGSFISDSTGLHGYIERVTL